METFKVVVATKAVGNTSNKVNAFIRTSVAEFFFLLTVGSR